MKKKQQQQHPGGGGDPWSHGAPVGGAPPCLGSCKRRIPLLPFLRFSLRDYGFCMATLLVFCLGSLFYQLSGGPPRFLLDLRQYLGKEGLRQPRKVGHRGKGDKRGTSKAVTATNGPRDSPGGMPKSIPPCGCWERLLPTALGAVRSDVGFGQVSQAGTPRTCP